MLEEGLASSVNDALDQPPTLCMEILESRAYARARAALAERDGADEGAAFLAYWEPIIRDVERLEFEAEAAAFLAAGGVASW